MDPWRYCTDGISVALRVTPRGGRDDIDGVETLANGRTVVKVRVRAIAEGGEANRDMMVALNGSDFREGVASFMEKRPPRFTGK